jgi:hypothetical protein
LKAIADPAWCAARLENKPTLSKAIGQSSSLRQPVPSFWTKYVDQPDKFKKTSGGASSESSR